jgi:hypothetical protein
MTLVDSVSDWVQIGLNAGALVAGGVVWKMYFENLKATIGTKDAEVSLANKQVDYWREKATELEKRSPEAVERVLAERISIREGEIERLAKDREHDSLELERVEKEVGMLHRILDQTRGFREVLAMEQPDPTDPDYEEYVQYIESRADQPVEVEIVYMGVVSVDSGQLLITDPCYIDHEWLDEPFESGGEYRDTETGAIVRWGQDFANFGDPLETYGASPKELIEAGRLIEVPSPPTPETFKYSYNGACQATLSDDGVGELVFAAGHAGAGVVFQSGWGDGFYPVYGEKHDGRIMRVYINLGADPLPPSLEPASTASVASTTSSSPLELEQ